MSHWEEFERRVRARGVRVEQRLALLALLREPETRGGPAGEPSIARRREALLSQVGELARKIKESL